MDLIERVKGIVLSPKTEWSVIAPEVTDTGTLYRSYVVPLAAITPVAQFVGLSIIGVSVPFLGNYRTPLMWGLSQAIVSYVLGLIGVYVISLIINGLAPSFGGSKNPMQALKVAAYSLTPAWIAGILMILPSLGILGLLAGLYSLYVLYLGLPELMTAPRDKAMGYTAVVVICAAVVMIVISTVAGAVGGYGMGSGRFAAGMAAATLAGNSGNSSTAPLNQMAAQMAAAASQMKAAQQAGDTQGQMTGAANAVAALAGGGNAQIDPVDQNLLKALLPDSFAGLPRTGFEASKGGLGNLQVSKAEGHYGNGQGNSVDLTITDMGGTSMLGALTAWAMFEQDNETDTGYEKMGKVDGRPVHEVFNKNGPHAEYTTLVASRFLVEAEGQQTDMDTVKKGVASVDLGKLEAMKNDGVKKLN